MLDARQPVSLVTVTHEICGAFIERAPRMLAYFTLPSQIEEHFVVINGQTREHRREVYASFGSLPWKVTFVEEPENRWDLPAYNDLMERIRTDFWIAITPDVRLFNHHWINAFLALWRPGVGLIGPPGPGATLTAQDIYREGDGWIPRLLVDRGLPFDTCQHVQTWCFCMLHEAFKEVGGFWETPERKVHGKGDVIASEIFMSVAMRRAGYEIVYQAPYMHHYGTRGADSLEAIDAFDRDRGWEIPF